MSRNLAVLCVALVAVVAVLSIGRVTSAGSAGSTYTERQILSELKEINQNLEDIKYNTGATCQDASSGYSCQKFRSR